MQDEIADGQNIGTTENALDTVSALRQDKRWVFYKRSKIQQKRSAALVHFVYYKNGKMKNHMNSKVMQQLLVVGSNTSMKTTAFRKTKGSCAPHTGKTVGFTY